MTYKIIYETESRKQGLFIFSAKDRDDANRIYSELRYEHDCYLPKIKRILWSGTLDQWIEETKNRNYGQYAKHDNSRQDQYDFDLQQDVDEDEEGN